jgi:hypothetical protein
MRSGGAPVGDRHRHSNLRNRGSIASAGASPWLLGPLRRLEARYDAAPSARPSLFWRSGRPLRRLATAKNATASGADANTLRLPDVLNIIFGIGLLASLFAVDYAAQPRSTTSRL